LDEENYIKLLDEAIEKIPDEAKDTDRWTIPVAQIVYEGKNTIITNFKKICDELNLKCINPLWHKDETEYLEELLNNDFKGGIIQLKTL